MTERAARWVIVVEEGVWSIRMIKIPFYQVKLGGRDATLPAIAFLTLLFAVVMARAAFGDDTDRLANCVAIADMASAAAKSRDAGVPPAKTIAVIAKQVPEGLQRQVNETVADVYSDHRLSPDGASARVLQSCFDPK
jgi:hypothetical protein